MIGRKWYNDIIDVEGSADIDLNQLIKEHREDAIKLFTDEELHKELQLRENGKSQQEKYISDLDINIDYLRVSVDKWDVMDELDDSNLLEEIKHRDLNVAELINNISKKDLRKLICQTLDINECYTDEEILKMLENIWKIQV